MPFHTQDTLEDYVVKSIGLVAAEWSLCEAHLAVAIWDMLEVDWEQGHIITDDLTASARIKMFRALAINKYEGADQTTLSEAEELYKRLHECNVERNDLVHNIWSSTGAHKFAANKYSARSGKLKITPKAKTGDEFLRAVEDIGSLIDDVDAFVKKNRA